VTATAASGCAVAAGGLAGLDLGGDDGDVVLQAGGGVARMADEPLVDALGVVDAHQRPVERVEPRRILLRLVAQEVVIGLVPEAEVVAQFVDDAGDAGAGVAAVVERLRGRVGEHAHVAVPAGDVWARDVPGEGHRRLHGGHVDVEHREVDGDLPPGLRDRGRFGRVERRGVAIDVVGAVRTLAVEIEIDRGRRRRPAVEDRQPVGGRGGGRHAGVEAGQRAGRRREVDGERVGQVHDRVPLQ